jgi:aminoglycoside/choline kinase family phosphotransferase
MEKQDIAFWLTDFIQGQDFELSQLGQSGSERQNYILILLQKKYIVTYNKNTAENEAFFYWTEQLQAKNIAVPHILKISEDNYIYIQSYLSAQTLAEYMAEHGHNDTCRWYLESCINTLVDLQQKCLNHSDFTHCFEYRAYDKLPVYNDLFYFKNFFIDFLELPYHKANLIAEFEKIAHNIELLQGQSLMLRDFQSRNIMVSKANVAFIDYQSAMKGPICYDVVSLLYQAKANCPQDWKDELVANFFEQWQEVFSLKDLHQNYKYCQLMRFTQVLGAYGFRGLVQGKTHFIESIPQGIDNLQDLAINWQGMHTYPELKKLILSLKKQHILQYTNTLKL